MIIVGEGPYRSELERVAHAEGVAEQVDFFGYVSDSRLPGLYAGADVYLNFSGFKPYGITVAEALAAGTVCVVRGARALKKCVVKELRECLGTVTRQRSKESTSCFRTNSY